MGVSPKLPACLAIVLALSGSACDKAPTAAQTDAARFELTTDGKGQPSVLIERRARRLSSRAIDSFRYRILDAAVPLQRRRRLPTQPHTFRPQPRQSHSHRLGRPLL